MNSPDFKMNSHLEAALQRVRTAVEQAAERCAEGLGLSALSAGQIKRREALLGAQFLFRKQQGAFSQRFFQSLRDQLSTEQAPKATPAAAEKRNWTELSLMDDTQVDALVAADRIGLAIGHQSEWELREVDSYLADFSSSGRSPLRPELIGQALLAAVQAVSEEAEVRQILLDELTRALAQEMRQCYADIAELFRDRGLRPQDLRRRGPDTTSNSSHAHTTRSQPLSTNSAMGGLGNGQATSQTNGQANGPPHAGRYAESSGWDTELRNPRETGRDADHYGAPSAARASGQTGGLGTVDAQLMALLRRLAQQPADSATEATPAPPNGFSPQSAQPQTQTQTQFSSGHTGFSGSSGFHRPGEASGTQDWHDDFSGPSWDAGLPPNLIQLHREELRQAATGRLDHMVIDVVGSLFDQILADPKVPPQMARLLARLQLPVLRAALGDTTFFSSRRHPVRRFVNRMASLACAFEDFTEDPGLAFLAHVRELVKDVADGDFENMAVYESKLDALEQFIAAQTAAALKSQGDAVNLLARKEVDLRLQQRYMQQLQAALAPVPMPAFLQDFLAQIWSQAIVLSARDLTGEQERTRRFKQLGGDLVMSVQVKSGTAQRQQFLGRLPTLMKTLVEGLDLIAWPEPARKEFFGHLLPAHAESLKGQALSALDSNLLSKQLEAIFGLAPPAEQDLPANAHVTVPQDLDMGQRLSSAEAKSLGLVNESGVDWNAPVDIDLDLGHDQDSAAVLQAVDISIEGLPASTDAPAPFEGELLIEHLQLGFAYQMRTGDSWHKVRLAHVSAGRSFFIFTQGSKHQETVTMTARMLKRLCEAKRLRAFENAYLLERAISRTRKQLAALSTGG
jgi:hypothetical protein